MLISVLSDNRGDFDALLGFYCAHLNEHRLMMWQHVKRGEEIVRNPDPASQSSNSATDGDADVAYALLTAGEASWLAWLVYFSPLLTQVQHSLWSEVKMAQLRTAPESGPVVNTVLRVCVPQLTTNQTRVSLFTY